MASSISNILFNYVPNNWVPIFNGETYDYWSIQMKTLLISQGLWDLVQYGYEQPKDANELATWDDNKKQRIREKSAQR